MANYTSCSASRPLIFPHADFHDVQHMAMSGRGSWCWCRVLLFWMEEISGC